MREIVKEAERYNVNIGIEGVLKLSILVDTFFTRIFLVTFPAPKELI